MLLFLGTFVLLSWVLVRLATPKAPRVSSRSVVAGPVRGLVRAGAWVFLGVLVLIGSWVVAQSSSSTGFGARVAAVVFMIAFLGGPAVLVLRRVPVVARLCRDCGHTFTGRTCPWCRAGADASPLGRVRRVWHRVATQPKRP